MFKKLSGLVRFMKSESGRGRIKLKYDLHQNNGRDKKNTTFKIAEDHHQYSDRAYL